MVIQFLDPTPRYFFFLEDEFGFNRLKEVNTNSHFEMNVRCQIKIQEIYR